MGVYFRVLAITGAVQLLGFWMGYGLDSGGIMGVGVLVSLVLGIWLPIRWQKTALSRIATIVLLPTNYTWMVLVLIAALALQTFLEIFRMFVQAFS